MESWFNKARFGMFIHWGHCSQRGLELSWPLVGGVGALPDGQSVGGGRISLDRQNIQSDKLGCARDSLEWLNAPVCSTPF